MADITVGVVGDDKSYYPLTRSERRFTRRGNVDIVRIPIGTNCNKIYLDPSDVSTSATKKFDEDFIIPGEDYYTINTSNNDQNAFKYGFKQSNFVYSGTEAGRFSNYTVFKTDDNHTVNWEMINDCVALNGMRIIFNIDLPIWGRSKQLFTDDLIYKSSNARYSFVNKSTVGEIHITMSDNPFGNYNVTHNTIPAPAPKRPYVRIQSNNGGSDIVDDTMTIDVDDISDDNPIFSVERVYDNPDWNSASGQRAVITNPRQIDDSTLVVTDTLPDGFRTFDYSTVRLGQGPGTTDMRSPDNEYKRRFSANFEFVYGDSISALYMSGYVTTSTEAFGDDGFPDSAYKYYRVKIWEGDIGVRLREFNTSFFIQSDRSQIDPLIDASQHISRPIEIMTSYCRLLYPNLYETFKVKAEAS